MAQIEGYRGSLGTGYPFYILDKNLEGYLPIINEQFRYNNELIDAASRSGLTEWICSSCMVENYDAMIDLKVMCKPCSKIIDPLKPRKLMNRLPDVDMWMVCDDYCIEEAKNDLVMLFEKHNLHTSDVDPIRAISDMDEIANDLKNGIMPTKALPLDVHIIEYSKFAEAVEAIPYSFIQAKTNSGYYPFIPIQPVSLRKIWQQDDSPYNFALDFLYSMTAFNIDPVLDTKINESKNFIVKTFTKEELYNILELMSPDSVKRRLETKQLQKTFLERVESWK